MPRQNRPYPRFVSWAFERLPVTQSIWRAVLFARMESLTASIRHPKVVGRLVKLQSVLFMRSQLRDSAVRRKAWPDFVFGCKRVLFSSAFLPALQRHNVELITERIERMTPAGPQTVDGRVHEVDCVIYGTGFKATEFMFPMEITGRNRRSLREEWSGGAHAHLGITVPGFPSMFVMYGPNTNTSGGSIIFFLEAQAKYLRQAIQLARSRKVAAVDVRPDVERASSERLQLRFRGTAWTQCDSWYRDAAGRIVANWPGYMHEYARATATLDADDFDLVTADADGQRS